MPLSLTFDSACVTLIPWHLYCFFGAASNQISFFIFWFLCFLFGLARKCRIWMISLGKKGSLKCMQLFVIFFIYKDYSLLILEQRDCTVFRFKVMIYLPLVYHSGEATQRRNEELNYKYGQWMTKYSSPNTIYQVIFGRSFQVPRGTVIID